MASLKVRVLPGLLKHNVCLPPDIVVAPPEVGVEVPCCRRPCQAFPTDAHNMVVFARSHRHPPHHRSHLPKRLTAPPFASPECPGHAAANPTTRSIIESWPKVSWCHVHLCAWTWCWLRNLWQAQKSNHRTVRIRRSTQRWREATLSFTKVNYNVQMYRP